MCIKVAHTYYMDKWINHNHIISRAAHSRINDRENYPPLWQQQQTNNCISGAEFIPQMGVWRLAQTSVRVCGVYGAQTAQTVWGWTVQDLSGSFRAVEGRWGLLRTVKGCWEPLRAVEDRWGPLRTVEDRWGPLRAVEDRWGPLRAVEGRWGPLKVVEGRWILLKVMIKGRWSSLEIV